MDPVHWRLVLVTCSNFGAIHSECAPDFKQSYSKLNEVQTYSQGRLLAAMLTSLSAPSLGTGMDVTSLASLEVANLVPCKVLP